VRRYKSDPPHAAAQGSAATTRFYTVTGCQNRSQHDAASRSSSPAPGPKDLGSGTLPGIPCPKDLSCDLVWIRPSDRFELLQPTCEAIGQIQITELIRCDPV